MSILYYASFAFFAAVPLNLIIELGFGLDNATDKEEAPFKAQLLQYGCLFVEIGVLWCFFTYLLSPLGLGFFKYFLLFPASACLSIGVNSLLKIALPEYYQKNCLNLLINRFNSAFDGIIIAAIFFTLRFATNILEALCLTFGFCFGLFFAFYILRAIRRKSLVELVPTPIQGIPLLLISGGLLSMIFSSISDLIFRIMGM
ncbi:MAG: hypothetical protein LBM77_02685 [Spirochaetaceae bacterium]|jgi:electron transport complex protein RnfA|nr:hypothetical protein [Spirochaetaceae bacterium]